MRASELYEDKLSKQQIADIVAAYAEGISYNELARQYEVDRKTIAWHITRQPNYPELRAQHWATAKYEYTGAVNFSRDEIKRMYDMYMAGQSYTAIGRAFGITGENVRHNIERYDPQVGARERTPLYAVSKNITPDAVQHMAYLYGSGMPVKKIAKQYGIDHKTVRYHLGKLPAEQRKDLESSRAAVLGGALRENDDEHRAQLQKTGFWGARGAGCLFLALDTRRICIAHRSEHVEQPNTWGTWGGAIDRGESPETAVEREAREEAGYSGAMKLVPLYVFKHPSGFTYYNYLAIVESEFKPQLDWETQGYSWITYPRWPQPLHPGMKLLLSDPDSIATIKRYTT